VIVDFHSHTSASDGTLTAGELVAAMTARKVEIFSVTDHDTLGSYDVLRPNGVDCAEIGSATLVPGIEINTTYRGNEVHILGYGFDLGTSKLRDVIEENRRSRGERAQKMVEMLNRAGVEISIEAVRAEASDDAPLGRPHVAKALVRSGATRDVSTAFRDLLSDGRPGYVPSHHILPSDAIAAVANSGGVPVLAHPGRLKDEALIEELAAAGLVGLEVFYPTHSAAQVERFRDIATQFGLVMTAGSDFHDPRYNARGVGMDVDADDIRPFLDLIALGAPGDS
jgi:predicted metal-dependent phosphoesterase TrpH